MERIRAIEPEFDGLFLRIEPEAVAEAAQSADGEASPNGTLNAGLAGLAARARKRSEPLSPVDGIVRGMSQPLVEAGREPFAAPAVIYALLLSRDDPATRQRQLQLLNEQLEPPLMEKVRRLADTTKALPEVSRLPAVHRTIPALKRASPAQYARFRKIVEGLMAAEHRIGLFEYCLRCMVFSYLDVHFRLKKLPAVRYRTLDAVCGPARIVLSTLAYAGRTQLEEVQEAFQAAARAPGRQGDARRTGGMHAEGVRCGLDRPDLRQFPGAACRDYGGLDLHGGRWRYALKGG